MEKYNTPFFFICIVLLFELVCVCCGENVKKSVDNLTLDSSDDNGDNEDSKDVAMEIPSDIEQQPPENKTLPSCNTRRANTRMHPIKNAVLKQFPFIASLMSLSDEHLCTGTVISNGMLLTTASCVEKQISHILLNTVRAKLENKGEIRISVIRSEKFPSYTGKESVNNVGIVYTHKFNNSVASKLKLSNYTSAQKLTDLEVFGFGLNQDVGHTRDLQYVGLENRFYLEVDNTIKAYIDCVESKEPTCFKDVGGPAIYGNEMIGVVIKGQDECVKEMTANYALNKVMATILPVFNFKSWLIEKIKKNEDADHEFISTYPSKLVAAQPMKPVKVISPRSFELQCQASIFTILLCMFSLYFYS